MSDGKDAGVKFGDSWVMDGAVSIGDRIEGEVNMQSLGEHPVHGKQWPQLHPRTIELDLDPEDCALDDLREAAGPQELHVEYGGETFEVVDMHNGPLDELDRDECDDRTVALAQVPGPATLELAEMEVGGE